MSTKLHDVAGAAILAFGLPPQTLTATTTGDGVDLIHADGRCFAVQMVGSLDGTNPTLAGKVQESADNATGWTDIPGATFATVSDDNDVQAVTFDRTKRYVRYVGTIAGTDPEVQTTVVIGEQKKQA